MKKILAVFNTCGISGKENSKDYIESINSILNQDFYSFDLIVSSCLNNQDTLDSLIKEFGNAIKINNIKEKHPVNVTFNHSVKICVDRFGEYEGYLYIDSGTRFPKNNILSDMYSHLKTGKYGMITPQPENDTEYFYGLGVGRFDKDDEYAKKIIFASGNYVIPPGKAMATHTNLISNELRKFYGNVYPDIFASHCTESTFSFLNAALKKNWILLKDHVLPHKISLDGQSSGFSPYQWISSGGQTYDHPYKIASVVSRILTKEAYECGFGYEECRKILIHDPSQFDENHHCINENLKHFIKSKLFLSKEDLNYEKITHEFIY
jgi:hypothetical protein